MSKKIKDLTFNEYVNGNYIAVWSPQKAANNYMGFAAEEVGTLYPYHGSPTKTPRGNDLPKRYGAAEWKAGKPIFGFEVEWCNHHVDRNPYSEQSKVIIATVSSLLGMYGEEDCTVSGEHASRLMQSAKPIVDRLANVSKWVTLSDVRCGLHTNFSMFGDDSTPIENNKKAVFDSVYDAQMWLESHPKETENLFGRTLGGWAERVTCPYDLYRHTSWFHLRPIDDTEVIEFRLPHYVDARNTVITTTLCRDLFIAAREGHNMVSILEEYAAEKPAVFHRAFRKGDDNSRHTK